MNDTMDKMSFIHFSSGKTISILVALCCLLSSLQVSAEPSGLVKKLMETEATLFDLGLLRLQRRLEDDVILKRYYVSYSSLTNEIEIVRGLTSFGDEGEAAEKICVEGKEFDCFEYLKKQLTQETYGLCMPSKGKCSLGISHHFAHSGFIKENFYNGKDSEEAVKPLDDITVAKIHFTGGTYFVFCQKYIKREEVKCSAIQREKLK